MTLVKIHSQFFKKSLHMFNKSKYKISSHLKQNAFEFYYLITTQKLFLQEKYGFMTWFVNKYF